jgi:hypothetical protein
MQTYLVLRGLDKGGVIIPPQSRTRLEWLSAEDRAKLVMVGAVRKLASPPLTVLAGWRTRAEKLLPLGIETLEQFWEAEVSLIARTMRVKPVTVRRWRSEVEAWHTADGPAVKSS